MKVTAKNLPSVVRVVLLCIVVATLFWELLARLLLAAGIDLSLSVGPVGFDVYVLAVSLRANPGTILGLIPAAVVVRSL